MELFLTILLWTFVWYFVGIVSVILNTMYSKGELTVGHISEALVIGICGPFIPLLLILGMIYNIGKTIINSIDNHLTKKENVVLWRSRRNKTEHILYGKDKQ